MNSLKIAALLLTTIYSTNSQALECKMSDPEEFAWIASIDIDKKTRKVTLIETEDQGKKTYTTELIDLSDNRYTFNLPPLENSGVANMFLLFKSFDQWRLLSVGTEQKGGKTVLKAVDKSTLYDCIENTTTKDQH